MLPRRLMFLNLVILLAGLSAFAQTTTPDLNASFRIGTLEANAFHHRPDATEKDDAFHYQFWQGTPYDGAYTEWWYFNLYDKQQDLQAVFSYQVVDPANVTGQGTAFVSAAAYQGSNIVNTFDLVPLSSFSASYTAANVALGSNKISVRDPFTYLINGSSANGRISWNLRYARESEPWFAGDHVNVAPADWEQMSWLLYMPRAHVSGTVTVDGNEYNVESSGYHDHNWGEWDFAQVRWNWAQHSEPGLSFELGDFIDNPNGRAAINVRGRRIVFDASQYKLIHTKWAYDNQNQASFPTESVFTADNGTVRVSVTMDVVKTDPLPVFPGQVIYEQPTHFTGVVTGIGGDFENEIKLEGEGFKEYTAVTNSRQQ